MSPKIIERDFTTSEGEEIFIKRPCRMETYARAFKVPREWLEHKGIKYIVFKSPATWNSEPIRLEFTLTVRKYIHNKKPIDMGTFNFDEVIPPRYTMYQIIELINRNLHEQTKDKPFHFHAYLLRCSCIITSFKLRLKTNNPQVDCYRFLFTKGGMVENSDGEVIRSPFDELMNQNYRKNRNEFRHWIYIPDIWNRRIDYSPISFRASFHPNEWGESSYSIYLYEDERHSEDKNIIYNPEHTSPTLFFYTENGMLSHEFRYESFTIHAKFVIE